MGIGGAVIWALALGIGVRQAEAAGSLTVLVYNYANVPAATLLEAEAFAARSYRAAGFQVRWVHCATSEADTDRFRTCEQARDDRALQMNIIPERMAAGIRPSRQTGDTLGIALQAHAFVLSSRVREMARVWGIPEYMILGRTMAHELGHLLLGENSHSAAGLMRPHFSRRDLALDSGQFLFDPQQAQRLIVSLHRH